MDPSELAREVQRIWVADLLGDGGDGPVGRVEELALRPAMPASSPTETRVEVAARRCSIVASISNPFWQNVAQGSLLVAAVVIQQLRNGERRVGLPK